MIDMPSHEFQLLTFVAFCFAGAALGAAIIAWLRWRSGFSMREGFQGVLGITVSFVAVLFSFFLGFTVVNLWQAFDHADRLVQEEVNEIRTVYRLSEAVDDSSRMKQAVAAYARWAVLEEWPAMMDGGVGIKTNAAKDRIWREALRLAQAPATPPMFGQEILESVVRFNKLRRERLNLIGPSLHPLLKSSIVILGAFTLAGFYFLGGENRRVQFAVDFMVIASIVISLYLIHALDDPFSGTGFYVKSDAFLDVTRSTGAAPR